MNRAKHLLQSSVIVIALLALGKVDVSLVDASFFNREELGGRTPVAHPLISETIKYWGGSPALGLLRYARSAMLPEFIKKPVRAIRYRRGYRRYVKTSLISADFAHSVDIDERIERMRTLFPTSTPTNYCVEYCDRIWPNMTAGR